MIYKFNSLTGDTSIEFEYVKSDFSNDFFDIYIRENDEEWELGSNVTLSKNDFIELVDRLQNIKSKIK